VPPHALHAVDDAYRRVQTRMRTRMPRWTVQQPPQGAWLRTAQRRALRTPVTSTRMHAHTHTIRCATQKRQTAECERKREREAYEMPPRIITTALSPCCCCCCSRRGARTTAAAGRYARVSTSTSSLLKPALSRTARRTLPSGRRVPPTLRSASVAGALEVAAMGAEWVELPPRAPHPTAARNTTPHHTA
jgi:hypothetical protein